MTELSLIFSIVGAFFREYWWLIVPPFLIAVVRELWLYYIKRRSELKIEWVTLGLRVPQEILKTPKAMEQIFAGVHAVKTNATWREENILGKIQEWLSFELVGTGGSGIYFFIRTPKAHRNLIESQIYAQYPEVEITEVEDYTHFYPPSLPDKNYDLWGTEYFLDKEDCYPIRTYPSFEEVKEEKRVDPLANLFEWCSRLKEGEAIWIQILIKPTGSDWKKAGDKIVTKLMGKPAPPVKKGVFQELGGGLGEFSVNLIKAPFTLPVWSESKKADEKLPSRAQFLSPGERDVIEKIEEKMAKIGFKTGLRALYIAKTDVFSKASVAAINAYLRQFNTQNLNTFKANSKISTKIDYWFKFRREYLRKVKVFRHYRNREWPVKTSILNIEELASIYHFPIRDVQAPSLQRLESRKGAPPQNLPIG